jgi:AmiR/NasT family two-component response regulator
MERNDNSGHREVARASEELAKLILDLQRRAKRLPPVGQAKVIIMDRLQCGAVEAADLLDRASMALLRTVSDLAAELVAALILGEPTPAWLDEFAEL